MANTKAFTHLIGNPEVANAVARKIIKACFLGENPPMSLGQALKVAKHIEILGGRPPAPTFKVEHGRCIPQRGAPALEAQ